MSVAAPTPASLDGLRAAVAGPVLTPEDDGYTDELAGFNIAVSRNCAVVVGATSAADVIAAVSYGAANGLAVGVQATGHGPCHTMDEAVIVSTKRMQGLTIDAEAGTARAEAGVRWGAVIKAAAPHGL